MRNNVLLDTTVIADLLLKRSATAGTEAAQAIALCPDVRTLVYAIKEFQLGPLRGFVYVHNLLLSTRSLSTTVARLSALSRTPSRNLTSTALEALSEAMKLATARGQQARPLDTQLAHTYRLALKGIIFRAWERRRTVAEAIAPLSCYAEGGPQEDHLKVVSLGPHCDKRAQCALAGYLRLALPDVVKVRDAILRLKSSRPEDTKRTRALKDFIKKPEESIGSESCRHLGDAVFAILCPPGGLILTTNTKDHSPLANALGKTAKRPSELLKEEAV